MVQSTVQAVQELGEIDEALVWHDGDQRRSKVEWIFNDDELDVVSQAMVGRYRTMSLANILSCPRPLQLLFAWRQGGDEVGPRELIEANISSDDSFIATLEALRGRITTGEGGIYDVLKRDSIGPFLDFDLAMKRVDELKHDAALGVRTQRLAEAFEQGKHF